MWQDIRYRIVDPAYGPIHLTSDDLYPYDRVGLIQTGTATAYYSQTLDPIAPKDIIALQPLSQGQKEDAK